MASIPSGREGDQAIEDLGLMRLIPGIVVIDPATPRRSGR
jgi:hypothetical protein